ncbi:MAG: RNA 2'-phosphotransferase [Planctomycetaceae bacterium]|nr:RNA 2'-phosphotransferase [Planctomycetaceae bacterium]
MTKSNHSSQFRPPSELLQRWLLWKLRHGLHPTGRPTALPDWIEVRQLLNCVPISYLGWTTPTVEQFTAWLAEIPGERVEVDGEMVRARYGHSQSESCSVPNALPPVELFHGTDAGLLPDIQQHGLLPMGRTRVHLTSELTYAKQLARRFTSGAVLRVDATGAVRAGIQFVAANSHIWQVSEVPPAYLSIQEVLSS